MGDQTEAPQNPVEEEEHKELRQELLIQSRDFCKFMVPVSTGAMTLIGALSKLLIFDLIKEVSLESHYQLGIIIAISASLVSLLISVISFVLGAFPIGFFGGGDLQKRIPSLKSTAFSAFLGMFSFILGFGSGIMTIYLAPSLIIRYTLDNPQTVMFFIILLS